MRQELWTKAISSWLQVKPDLNGRQRREEKTSGLREKVQVEINNCTAMGRVQTRMYIWKKWANKQMVWRQRGGRGKVVCRPTKEMTVKRKSWRWPRWDDVEKSRKAICLQKSRSTALMPMLSLSQSKCAVLQFFTSSHCNLNTLSRTWSWSSTQCSQCDN